MILFYWFIAVMPLESHPIWGRSLGAGLTVIKALGLMCLAVAVWRYSRTRRSAIFNANPQTPWILALLLIGSLSYVVHGGDLASGGMVYSHLISILVLFLTVPTLLDTQLRLYRSVLMAVAGFGWASLYAIRQNQKYGDIRSVGMFSDANQYVVLASVWMPVAFLWIFSRRPRWERAVCAVSLLTMGLGTTFAASRGGVLGMAAGFLYLVARSRSRVRNFVILAVAGSALLLLFPNTVLRRFWEPNHGDLIAQESRRITWAAGMRMMLENPFTGVGLHNFKAEVANYEAPGDMKVVGLCHNTYIELGAELGILGVAVFVGVLAATVISLEFVHRRARKVGAQHLGRLAIGLQAGVIAYSTGIVTITLWWEKTFWLAMFFAFAAYRASELRLRKQRRPWRLRTAAMRRRDAADASAGVGEPQEGGVGVSRIGPLPEPF